VAGHEGAIRSLARLTDVGEDFTPSASIEVGLTTGVAQVELDLSGAIDVVAERTRLDKDLAAARKELEQTEKKLANPAFVDKAPAEIVDKIRGRRQAAESDIGRINARLATLPPS
ncbi:MAG: valine--tRNA ligase, partial [Pseudonocardiaceae bacterium]